MTHAAPLSRRLTPDSWDMDEQTADLAEVIETALAEIIGDSPLYRAVSEHAARAVQLWIDYRLQAGTLRVIITPPGPPGP